MTENETARPRIEVVEETEETLEVLTLRRTPRADKMAREQQLLEDAHEVRFGEREWRPQREAEIDDVRAAVDALESKRVEFPEPAPPAAEPLPPEPEHPAAPEPQTVEIPEDLRAALTPIVPGALRSVDVLHREGHRRVVEVAYETAEGERTRGIYVVTGDEARPFDDIAAHIDALPTPTIPEAPSHDETPDATGEPEPAPDGAPAGPAEGVAPDEAPKKKGLLGRFGRKSEAPAESEPETAPPADAGADAGADAASPTKKGLLGRFGKKPKDETPAADAEDEPADTSPPAKKRFGLRRK